MEIGLVFPTTEIGDDPDRIRRYVSRAEQLGFGHLLTYEHVLGTDPNRPDWEGPFDAEDPFYEPFTLFSHLAAVTESIEFVSGILILPQRQTALVAKQATEVYRLSNGRFRLGVGLGWNQPEYQALGESFTNRADRIEEQINLLRQLWSEEIVDFDGDYHTVDRMGLNPRPDGGSIPLWMGGGADPVLDRIARMADGWLPQFQPGQKARDRLSDLEERCQRHGREFGDVGIHGRTKYHENRPLEQSVEDWANLGADYLSVNPMYENWDGPDHLDNLESIADEVEDWL